MGQGQEQVGVVPHLVCSVFPDPSTQFATLDIVTERAAYTQSFALCNSVYAKRTSFGTCTGVTAWAPHACPSLSRPDTDTNTADEAPNF